MEVSSRNSVAATGFAATAGEAPVAETGFGEATATFAEEPLTMVVAGLPEPALAATTAAAPAAAAATMGTAPAGFAVGILPGDRTAAAGRFGLTVMRAVSFGGADLTMEVPVLLLGGGTGTGDETTGFSGTLPGGGGTTTVVAGVEGVTGVIPGAIGLIGLNGATGLIGLTGRTAPGPDFAAGRTGAGGIPGLAGATAPGVGITGGGGPAFGVPDGDAGVFGSKDCVLRGGATVPSGDGAGGTGADGVTAGALVGGIIAVVVGDTLGGARTELDFFFGDRDDSTTAPVTTAAAIAAGRTLAGRAGVTGAGLGCETTAVLLAGEDGETAGMAVAGGLGEETGAAEGDGGAPEPTVFEAGGTAELGRGRGTTGTELVGGFAAGETPVAEGAEGVVGTGPLGFFAGGTKEGGKGTGTTGTEPVGGFVAGETPVTVGADGVP